MDNISPLAKTLAESNGIDWRAIQGTGNGGQVVEQDIINYLTRVMSGEEEPPATPVDLPPPDWTGDELPAGMSAEILSQAGVESDIAALVNQAPVAEAPAGQSLPGSQSSAALEEDEFELDLEDEDLTPVQPAVPASQGGFGQPAQLASAQPVADTQSTGAAAGGLGSLLSQLYQSPAHQSEPVAAEPEPTPAEPAQTEPAQTESVQPSVAPAASFSAPSASSFGSFGRPSGFGQPVDQSAEPQSAAVTPAKEEEPTEPAYAQAEATQPTLSGAPAFTDEAAPTTEAPVATEASVAEPAPAALAPTEESPAAEPAAPAAKQQTPAPEERPAVAAPAATAPASAAAERPEKAVWFGVYLRRDADLQAASELRDQLNVALGQDVPLSLLLARAAQQHASLLNLNAVAIQDAYSHRVRSVGAAGSGLRDALSALDRDHEGEADLLVVNAGTFELDELHYPDAVTLSLGRMVDGRAALSLNGDVDTAQAAEFLAAVAASLETPVALIV
ncbi:E3 binding domain-containing protein [Deinococcus sp. Marseille-Q6407]|uniref:E3 binding domain-containing protein n=1 Tax=Deinococcus sp. Marseille-Q6407 TaxID=2969223 RepID=UPI0021BE8458|nr:E3 binding domain-containing protein [Deinococcus sp. Marseille-Q6407]